MAEITPQEKYDLGSKYKKAGIITAIIGAITIAVGGGLWFHGRQLQMQAIAEAYAHGHGELTLTHHQPIPVQPLGGKADAKAGSKVK